jgi:hypothetical protein
VLVDRDYVFDKQASTAVSQAFDLLSFLQGLHGKPER